MITYNTSKRQQSTGR